jgi:putative spermidine/putrescine transport system substrate-binding protein
MRNPLQGRHRAGTRAMAVFAVVALAASGAFACGAPTSSGSSTSSGGTVPEKPASPVTLNIVDVAGNLQLTQGILDNFVKEHSDIVSKITTSKATAPELPAKLKAQQEAKNLQIDLVLTGTDAMSAGIAQGLWTKITPDYDARLSNMKNYTDNAAKMQALAQGYAVEVVNYPSGPLLEYNPAKVTAPPKTPQDLLAWAKAHPGKFAYAVPRNSGPGRTMLMGLPYLLGDKDPKDPETGWDNTWKYLADLGQYITYYPSGTTENMTNLAKGTVDMVASTTGWFGNPIALGTVPKTMKLGAFDKFTWVEDAQYMAVPKGVSNDKLAAILQLMQFALKPDQQALTFDKMYFYPGPSIKGVTVDQAPAASQQLIKDIMPAEVETWITGNEHTTSLPAEKQVAAFAKWDQTIAGGKVKK